MKRSEMAATIEELRAALSGVLSDYVAILYLPYPRASNRGSL